MGETTVWLHAGEKDPVDRKAAGDGGRRAGALSCSVRGRAVTVITQRSPNSACLPAHVHPSCSRVLRLGGFSPPFLGVSTFHTLEAIHINCYNSNKLSSWGSPSWEALLWYLSLIEMVFLCAPVPLSLSLFFCTTYCNMPHHLCIFHEDHKGSTGN